MNTKSGIIILIFSIHTLLSCNLKNNKEDAVQNLAVDSLEMIRNYMYGLWSVDNGNMLNNDGYYFQPDGKVRLVASEYDGEWSLIGKDSLKMSFQMYSAEAQIFKYKIDSLNVDRMVLSSKEGSTAFRKVPFGINPAKIVLQGFVGEVAPGILKTYELELPSAKDISIELESENPTITFRFFYGGDEITTTALQKWRGIVTHGGKYRLEVRDTIKKQGSNSPSFSLRVFEY